MKRLTLLFALFLAGVVAAADLGIAPRMFGLVEHLPGGDLAGHFLLIGGMAYLLNVSLSAASLRISSLTVLKGSLILSVVVVIEELTQFFLPYRSFSLTDLLADFAGILVFGQLAALTVRLADRRKRRA